MGTLFISHSSHDNKAALEVASRLESRGHRSLFLDSHEEKGLRGGAGWERSLYTSLQACRAVIVVCTDCWIDSKWCFAEAALARMEGKSIFVLVAGGQKKLPSILTEGQTIDLRKDPEEGYRRLWRGLHDKGIVPAEYRQPLGPGDPPYPGLRAFGESDEEIFFGREREALEGVELLSSVRRQGHRRLMMVLGASGSGKSSLTRAAIVPRLRRDPREWVVVGPFRPGGRPTPRLAVALSRAFQEAGSKVAWEEILERLDPAAEAAAEDGTGVEDGEEAVTRQPPGERLLEALAALEDEAAVDDVELASAARGLRQLLASRGSKRSKSNRPKPAGLDDPLADLLLKLRYLRETPEATAVLVVDQFEELLHSDEEPGGRPGGPFLRLLRSAVEEKGSNLVVLATMRSDHLEAFQKAPELEGVRFKSLSLGPVSREGMREVIEEPARLGRIELEKGLTDRLLEDTATSDALPLLAFTLRVMWDRCRDKRVFTLQDYRELRGLRGAIALVADEAMEAALGGAGDERRLRQAFLRLARPAEEGSRWIRQPVSWDEFEDSVQPMLQPFIDMRLLVKRGGGAVEVAHEALFRSWETLKRWLDTHAEGLHRLREIQVDAARWEEADTEEEKEPYLWRGGRLSRALELREGGILKLERRDKLFIEASEAARIRQREEEAAQRRRLEESLAASLLEQGRGELLTGNRLRAAIYLSASYSHRSTSASLRMLLAQSLRSLPLATLSGHGGGIRCAAFDPAGERVVTASEDQTARIWNAASGELLVTLEGHEQQVTAVAFDLTGKRVLTASEDHTACVWDAASGRLRAALEGHTAAVVTAGFDPPGKRIVTASADDSARIWDADSGELLIPLERHASGVTSAIFDPRGQRVATASSDGTALIWDAISGELLRTLQGHSAAINALAYDARGARLATASYDHTAKVWDAATGRLLVSLEDHTAQVVAAAFDPAGGRLVTASDDRTAAVWDVAAGERLCVLEGHTRKVMSAEFDPTGEKIVTAGYDQKAWIWDAGSGEPVAELAGHSGPVVRAAFDGGGNRIVTASFDRTARVWDASIGAFSVPLAGHDGWIHSAAFSPSGEQIVTASEDGSARVWEAASGQLLGTLEGHTEGVKTAVFSAPGGEHVVTAGRDGTARVWEAATGRPVAILEGHGAPLHSARFSPDGSRVVTASDDGTARIWDAATGEAVATLTGHDGSVVAAEFDPAGERIVTASLDQQAKIWDAGTGELLVALEGHVEAVVSAKFDPAGERVVTASRDRTARVWDAASGGEVAVIEGHTGWIKSALFDPGGTRVVTASLDDTAKIWDASSGAPRASLEGHGGSLNSAAFDPTGERVVTASDDGTARIWDAASSALLATLDRHEAQVISASFDAAGGRVVTASSDHTARVWDCRLESRSPRTVEDLVGEAVPYQLVDGRVVPRERPRRAASL